MQIDIRFSSCNHHPTTQLSLTSHSPQVRVEYHVVYRIYLLCAVAPGLRPGSTVGGFMEPPIDLRNCNGLHHGCSKPRMEHGMHWGVPDGTIILQRKLSVTAN